MALSCHSPAFSNLSGIPKNICKKTAVGGRCRASSQIGKGSIHNVKRKKTVEQEDLEPRLQCNSYRMKQNSLCSRGMSLGIDLGLARTGVAVSSGYAPRAVTVVKLRGKELELRLMELAEQEEVDEFIVGLPKSLNGNESVQSNKVRSVAGRLAARAAERGWRVYLQNEYGTTGDALDFMINRGSKQRARHEQLDAYAAVFLLQRYFAMAGCEAELVWPKDITLQENLRQGNGHVHVGNSVGVT